MKVRVANGYPFRGVDNVYKAVVVILIVIKVG